MESRRKIIQISFPWSFSGGYLALEARIFSSFLFSIPNTSTQKIYRKYQESIPEHLIVPFLGITSREITFQHMHLLLNIIRISITEKIQSLPPSLTCLYTLC